jgi:site-specific DNA recombinase
VNPTQVAIYARVSCEQQVSMNTIESQLMALQEQVKRDGYACPMHHQFVDEGHSGSTLIRPALEQLRDACPHEMRNECIRKTQNACRVGS